MEKSAIMSGLEKRSGADQGQNEWSWGQILKLEFQNMRCTVHLCIKREIKKNQKFVLIPISSFIMIMIKVKSIKIWLGILVLLFRKGSFFSDWCALGMCACFGGGGEGALDFVFWESWNSVQLCDKQVVCKKVFVI